MYILRFPILPVFGSSSFPSSLRWLSRHGRLLLAAVLLRSFTWCFYFTSIHRYTIFYPPRWQHFASISLNPKYNVSMSHDDRSLVDQSASISRLGDDGINIATGSCTQWPYRWRYFYVWLHPVKDLCLQANTSDRHLRTSREYCCDESIHISYDHCFCNQWIRTSYVLYCCKEFFIRR